MMKEVVAKALAARVRDGETIGIGSGTTVQAALVEIGVRIKNEGLRVSGIATSHRSALLAEAEGIQVLNPVSVARVAWSFDGADEVDPALNMIKGRGAAMLTEKILARRSEQLVIIVSEEKMVSRLGERYPIPVEVIPEAIGLAEEGLKKLGAKEVQMRMLAETQRPMITEHNNLILDARFADIKPALEGQIKSLVGVVESGLFIEEADEVIVAGKSGVKQLRRVGNKIVESSL